MLTAVTSVSEVIVIFLQLILFASTAAFFHSLLRLVSHSFWDGDSGEEISTPWRCVENINHSRDSWLVLVAKDSVRSDETHTGMGRLINRAIQCEVELEYITVNRLLLVTVAKFCESIQNWYQLSYPNLSWLQSCVLVPCVGLYHPFLNRNCKAFRIFREFEQFSSSTGWRLMAGPQQKFDHFGQIVGHGITSKNLA